MKTVQYEVTVETVDQHGDIIDSDFSDCTPEGFAAAVRDVRSRHGDGCTHRLGVVRTIGSDDLGVIETQWAYAYECGGTLKLPTRFADAYDAPQVLVPSRFHSMLRNAARAAATIGGGA